MENQFFLGLSTSVVSFFLRYAVKDMPRWLAWIGVIIGVLLMAATLAPPVTRNSYLSFVLFIVGCLCILASIVVDRASIRSNIKAERHLSDEQTMQLIKEAGKLKQLMDHVLVMFVNGDAESEQYARDFIDAFRRAGLNPYYSWTTPDGPDQVGVIIAVQDPKSVPFEAVKLREALKAIGVDAEVQGIPRAGIQGAGLPDERKVAIYVAPRPL